MSPPRPPALQLAEYRQHIEKDAAFERRFQMVQVGEPSVPDTIQILRGLKPKLEEVGAYRRGACLATCAPLGGAGLHIAWSWPCTPARRTLNRAACCVPQRSSSRFPLPPLDFQHHGIFIHDRALVVAAELSDRCAGVRAPVGWRQLIV